MQIQLQEALKRVLYKLSLIADYVVEIDTSGIWTYRKWASGYAELDGTKPSATYSVSNASGSIYYAPTGGYTFPFSLAEVKTVNFGFAASSSNVWAWGAGVTANGIDNSYIARGGSASVTGSATVRVTGRWK